jgi:hypothetical protein
MAQLVSIRVHAASDLDILVFLDKVSGLDEPCRESFTTQTWGTAKGFAIFFGATHIVAGMRREE